MLSPPNYKALKVQAQHNILLPTAAPKAPAKPSYGKFGKDTLKAHFLKFCKVATKGKYSEKKATKKNLGQMPSPRNYNAFKAKT